MKNILTFAATIALTVQLMSEVPKVENVRASQRDGTKIVDILYDVEDAENDKLVIRVQISSDGGETFNVPARELGGDLGNDIIPGKNKKIEWNAGQDWDGEFSDKMRIRITASDRKGLPGLEWSKEIPRGGFLMGQDGGPEGSGPSVHINVEYSYWISKYKITNNQFCEFLNLAKAAGLIDSSALLLNSNYWGSPRRSVRFKDFDQWWRNKVRVIDLGDNYPIRWNVNQFEVNKNGNHAVLVSIHGAAAFASWHGFFLPEEVHWEKAARGEFDDAGEHRKYAWGNEKSDFSAIDKPVGWFNGINTSKKVENYFGIYDLTAVNEWVNTEFRRSSYPNSITLDAYYDLDVDGSINYQDDGSIGYSFASESADYSSYKTVGYDMIHHRANYSQWLKATFRVMRTK
ncbi:formylglycine-generating enzyme family protein [bacterium]|nr:formylglycine-generating enzyme family protein [bacterium]